MVEHKKNFTLAGDMERVEALNEHDFTEWSSQQPVAFDLVEGRVLLLAEEHQAPSRLIALRQIAEAVFDQPDAANAWLVTPLEEFRGVSPLELATESEAGRQSSLRALIRWSRATMKTGHG